MENLSGSWSLCKFFDALVFEILREQKVHKFCMPLCALTRNGRSLVYSLPSCEATLFVALTQTDYRLSAIEGKYFTLETGEYRYNLISFLYK